MNAFNGYASAATPINRPIYGNAQNQNSWYRVKPVSSIEEVRGINIDFDGSIFYFPDCAGQRIYTKQIGMDGMPIIKMYELKEIPASSQTSGDFITRKEFDVALSQIKEAFSQIMQPQAQPQESEKQKFDF